MVVQKKNSLGSVLEQASHEERTFIGFKTASMEISPEALTVSPIVNRHETTERRSVEMTEAVQQELFRWIGHPHKALAGKVSQNTEKVVLAELLQREISLPIDERALPSRARLVLMDGKAAGVVPADLFSASNEEFIRCVRQAALDKKLDLDAGEVWYSRVGLGFLEVDATFPCFVSEPLPGDIVSFGLSLRHSSVGLFPSQVAFYALRLFCTNGQVAPICLSRGNKRQRIRRASNEGAEKTLARVRELVNQAFKEIPERMAAFTNLAKQPVDLHGTIDDLVTRNRWSRHVRAELNDAIERNEHAGQSSAFGIVNLLSFLGTHGPQKSGRTIPRSVQDRLQLVAGVYAGQGIHQCPSCRRILAPSAN